MKLKRLSRLFLFLVLAAVGSCGFAGIDQIQKKLIGKWSGKDSRGINASFIFMKNGRLALIKGHNIIAETPTAYLAYQVNVRKGYDLVHVYGVNKSTKNRMRLFSLMINFLPNKRIQMGILKDLSQIPASFADMHYNDKIILNKTRI